MIRRGRRAAATTALALVLVSTIGALFAQATIQSRDRSTERQRIAADLARFELGIAAVVAEVADAAARAADSAVAHQLAVRRLIDRRLVDGVVVADLGSDQVTSVLAGSQLRPLTAAFDLSDVPGLATAAQEAAAGGLPRAIAPVVLQRGVAIVVVAPLVPPGTPLDVQSRRLATEQVMAAAVDYQHLRQPRDKIELWPGAAVSITTPTGTIGDPRKATFAEGTVTAGDEVWRVSVGRLEGDRRLAGWFIFATGLAAAASSYVTLRRQHERQRQAEKDSASRARQLELIAGTSAALQQSLDLAELLPTFCVSVVEEFELTSASVLVADDEGQLIEAFRYGDGWPDDVLTQFDLRRGWVSVGRLLVGSHQALDQVRTQSIQALSDLLTVAVSNAHLFLREQQAVSRLSELDALKNAFLGTVSHELRTSTTAVQGFGELLADHWDTLPEERRRELAKRIRRQAGSLRHLVDDLLDYARLEHQSLRVIPRQLSLSELVGQLTESMSPLVADHEVRLEIERDISAWADPIAVERILANLLSNAGKYAPGGTVVTVSVEQKGDRARLRVADQGPGIPAEERRRVFVRFYRLSNAETLQTRGAGIGLAILHDFASYSHAEVSIDDAPGGGAVITVDFPTQPVASPALTTT